MEIEFQRRRAYNTKQIRFIGNPNTYTDFKGEVVRNELAACDVFHDLMIWFIKESKAGRIKLRGRASLKAEEVKALNAAVEKKNGENNEKINR